MRFLWLHDGVAQRLSRSFSRTPEFLHSFLLGMFPVLHLYAENSGEATFADTLAPIATVFVIAALMLAVSGRFYRDLRKGAILVSTALTLAFSYGYAQRAVAKATLGLNLGPFVAPLVLMFVFTLLLVAVALGLRHWRGGLTPTTKVLNAMSVALVLLPAAQAIQANLQAPSANKIRHAAADEPRLGNHPARDIYYIVPDRYASQTILQKEFKFDNSAFLDSLRSRGFYVADKSVANYESTQFSLAASLNMGYINDELKGSDGAPPKETPLTLIKEPAIVRVLKSHGYDYVRAGSSWRVTASMPDPSADLSLGYSRGSEFATTLFETTIFNPIALTLGFEPRRTIHRAAALQQFRTIQTVLDRPGPKFVLMHLLLPHDPFVFDAKGGHLTRKQEIATGYDKSYVGQLQYTNRKLMALIDRLLAGPESERPIIVLQSDEGPYPERMYKDGALQTSRNWFKAAPRDIRHKFEILSAFYFPGGQKGDLYPSVSPVNTFRILLNTSFGANLPLLPDETYVASNGFKKLEVPGRSER